MNKTTTERRVHFDNIVNKAEADFNNNPKAYKSKLRWLAFLGYGYLFLILLLCLGILGGLVFMSIKSTVFLIMLVKSKLIIAVIVVVYIMFKSLFIKIPAPEGVRITKKQAPKLFAAIREMQQQLSTPQIHEVVITPELNAAIQQTPRLGIFGWQKNSLILGTELLMTMNHDQALAVVAHEMGHLTGGHSKFSGWIYRVRMSWMNILYTVGQINAVARWVFGKFFAWYAPYFNAYSFALARANEYEADNIAAQTTSADNLSAALVGTQVVSELFFAKFWKGLEKEAFKKAELNTQSYKQMQAEIAGFEFDSTSVQHVIDKALKIKTTHDDTHPALKDRIKALQGNAVFNFDAKLSAANHWFGNNFEQIIDEVASNWVVWNQPHWHELHEQGKAAKERLKDLSLKGDLTVPELVEKAQIEMFLDRKKVALQTFKVIYKQDNSEPNALYHLGTALLERKNDKGLQLLNKLMTHEDFVHAAGQQLYRYYDEHEMTTQAEKIQLQLDQQYDREDAFYDEIDNTTAKDEFMTVEISTTDKQNLKDSIKKYRGIKHVWLAGKKLSTRPDEPLYIILFELHKGEEENEVFAEELRIELDGYFSMINVENKKLFKAVKPHCEQLF